MQTTKENAIVPLIIVVVVRHRNHQKSHKNIQFTKIRVIVQRLTVIAISMKIVLYQRKIHMEIHIQRQKDQVGHRFTMIVLLIHSINILKIRRFIQVIMYLRIRIQ